jgi:hypothetical protein|nr:MAG TPA: hypothetical protein [Caudoviricetes sp.]
MKAIKYLKKTDMDILREEVKNYFEHKDDELRIEVVLTEKYSVFISLYIGSVEGDTYIQIDTYNIHIVTENICSGPERVLGMVMYKCGYSKKKTFNLLESVINEIYSVYDRMYGYNHDIIRPATREYYVDLTQDYDRIKPIDKYKEYLYEAIKVNAPFKLNAISNIDGTITFELKREVSDKYIILVHYHNTDLSYDSADDWVDTITELCKNRFALNEHTIKIIELYMKEMSTMLSELEGVC